jgi:hypothetical protein
MSEYDEGNKLEIPDYQTNWVKLKDQIPMFAPRDWKTTLDNVALGWQNGEKEYKAALVGFAHALALPNVPDLERKDASEYRDNLSVAYKGFFEGVNKIASGEKLKWSQVKELAEKSDELVTAGKQEDEQTMALLTAISETHVEGRAPEEIRQKIAQHAFKEIFETGKYRALEWTGAEVDEEVSERTTQDYFNEEKDELVAALHSNLWTKDEEKMMRKIYSAWKRIAAEADNNVDPEVADSLEDLWKATRGKNISNTSSLEILQLAEDIYQELEKGKGFDVDLNYDEDEL